LIEYQLPEVSPDKLGALDPDNDDERDEQVIKGVRSSAETWGRSHLGDIASSRERIESLIGDSRWQSLDDDVQIMMATADWLDTSWNRRPTSLRSSHRHVRSSGARSSLDRDLASRRERSAEAGPDFRASLSAIELACRSQGDQLHHDIEEHMVSEGISTDDILELMQSWRKLM
jgi:hypothetical protein